MNDLIYYGWESKSETDNHALRDRECSCINLQRYGCRVKEHLLGMSFAHYEHYYCQAVDQASA